jgi:hypothetical protein
MAFVKFGHREKWNFIKIPHGDFNFFSHLKYGEFEAIFSKKIILY